MFDPFSTTSSAAEPVLAPDVLSLPDRLGVLHIQKMQHILIG